MKGAYIVQTTHIPPIDDRIMVIERLICLDRMHITTTYAPSLEDSINNYTSFIFVESGTAFVSIGDKNYIVDSGNIIFIPPTQFHFLKSADGLPVSYIYASFISNSDIIKSFSSRPIRCNASDYNYLIVALDNAESALAGLLDKTDSQLSHLKDAYTNKCNTHMQIAYKSIELFLLILSANTIVEPVRESHKQTRHANITASVEEYLKARIRENISLQETAQHFGYSVSNIQKIFKAVTGQSIIVYFNKLKLEEAKKLIIENNMTFSQISSFLSFSNPNYFSRIFKTTVGMTPTEYANLHQKEKAEDETKNSKATRHQNKKTSKKSK